MDNLLFLKLTKQLTIVSDSANQSLQHPRLVVDVVIMHEDQRGPDGRPGRVLQQRC